MSITTGTLRHCSKCGQDKPLDEFHKDSSRKDGFSRWCKECKISVSRKWYQRIRNRPVKHRPFLQADVLRKCICCELEARNEKDLELFAREKAQKYGRRNICKKCFAERAREYREKHFASKGLCRTCGRPLDRKGSYCCKCCDRLNQINSLRHWEIRAKVMTKLGGQCVKCGIRDLRLLTINHLNGRNLRLTRDLGHKFYYRILRGEQKTDDLEVRCYNCNILYEFEKGYRKVPEGFKVDYLYHN